MNGGADGAADSKEGPKPTDPMNPMNMGEKGGKNSAADSKPQGNLEKQTSPSEDKPQPDGKANAGENREAPLGGTPGQDKESPEPKKGANQPDPKNQNKDAASGATGKPATDKKDDPTAGPNDKPQNNPADNAGKAKPNVEPERGMDKTPQPKGAPQSTKPSDEKNAGEGKPDKAPPASETKTQPPGGPMGKQGDDDTMKDPPKDPPGSGGGSASENKGDKDKKPMGGPASGGTGMNDKGMEKGFDKDDLKNQGEGRGDGAPDQDKKEDKKGNNGKKLDEKQLKEIQDSARDLNNPDPQKQQAARDKLDKTVGKDLRKAIEEHQKNEQKKLDQLEKDLQSKDEKTRKDAEKKLEDLQKKADEIAEKEAKETGKGKEKGKGKELTKEDADELAQKAADLNSEDPKKREEAEKAFDEKVGKDIREKMQEELKKQPPKDPKDPKTQEAVKNMLNELLRSRGGPDNTKALAPEAADPRNKAKTAELQLEEFEKHRGDRELLDRLKWTDDDYERFLKEQAKRVEQLQKDAVKFEDEMRNMPPTVAGAPKYDAGSGGKVESRPNAVGPGASTSGAGFAPPGFEDAKKKFAEAAAKAAAQKK